MRDGMFGGVLMERTLSSISDTSGVGQDRDELLGSRIALGWFFSYSNQAHPNILLVILMLGQSGVR